MSKDPALITGRLNVDEFVAARRDNIEQLENLLGSSGSGAKKRAFQSLPRIERRRAASHHPKRLPRKNGLRKLAEFEAIRDNSLIAKKRRRQVAVPKDSYHPLDLSSYNVPSTIPSEISIRYADRQRNKVWLPTHIWHKKRAFLRNIAGIEIPLTATQKQYRRTYRLTNHVEDRGAIAWDTSYCSTLVIRRKSHSSEDNFKSIIEKLFPRSSLGLYSAGNNRHWQGIYTCSYEINSTGGPALLQWIDDDSAVVQVNHLLFSKLWKDLVSHLDVIDVEDCRFAIGSIDVAGPRALNILKSVVNSCSQDSGPNPWAEICQTGIIPYRWANNICIFDPRILKEDMKTVNRVENGNVYLKKSRLDSLAFGPPKDQKSINSKSSIPAALYALDDGRIRLVLPRDWVLPLWIQIFSNRNSVMIGGQKELHQLAFESNCPFFPLDFPYTPEGKLAHQNQVIIGSDHLRGHLPSKKQQNTSSRLLKNLDILSLERVFHVIIDPLQKGTPLAGAQIFFNDELIGIVTTGNFSFSDARGSGIGIVKYEILGTNEHEICRVVNSADSEGFEAKLTMVRQSNVSRIL